MVAIVHSNLRNKLFKWKFFTVQDLNVWIQNESVTSFPRSVWGLHTWSGDGLYAYVRVSPLSSGWCCRSCDMVFAFHTSHFWPKSCIKSRGRCLATDGWLAGWLAGRPPSLLHFSFMSPLQIQVLLFNMNAIVYALSSEAAASQSSPGAWCNVETLLRQFFAYLPHCVQVRVLETWAFRPWECSSKRRSQ